MDFDFYEKAEPTNTWDCNDCGAEVARYRGQGDVRCPNRDCDAEYNSCGQQLRSDWRGNASTWDEDVSDMDGFEAQQCASDREWY